MTRFTVLVAALETRSALRATAVHTADAIAAHTGVPACIDVIDLAALGPALLAEEATDGVADALATIAATDVLIVATPQIHGSYTGLLKVFLDRLPELGLAHVIALPLAVYIAMHIASQPFTSAWDFYNGVIGETCPRCGRRESDELIKFERIRRITGYLVGTLDRFNDAKRHEEHDRVKHGGLDGGAVS